MGKGKLGGKPFQAYTERVMWVGYVGYTPDGRTIVSGSRVNTIRLWDAETGEAKLDGKALERHTSYAMPAAFSPDSKIWSS
jgi:WD40 repeat protein